MESLWILIPLSLLIAVGIGAAFWWAVSGGQMDDLDSPAQRILIDDDQAPAAHPPTEGSSPEAQKTADGNNPPTPNKALPVV